MKNIVDDIVIFFSYCYDTKFRAYLRKDRFSFVMNSKYNVIYIIHLSIYYKVAQKQWTILHVDKLNFQMSC